MDNSVNRWLRILLTAGFAAIAFFLMSAIAGVVKILIVSALLAYIIDPVAVKIEARGMGRGAATLIIFVSFTSVLIIAVIMLLPVLTAQIEAMHKGLTPEQVAVNIDRLDRFLVQKLSFLGIDNLDLTGRLERMIASFSDWMLSHILDVVGLLTHTVLIPFIVFFFLKDGREMKKQAARMIPNRYFEFLMGLLSKMDSQLGNFLRGQFLDALIFGVLSIAVLWFMGIKYFLLIGIFAGFANLIPFLGPVAGAALAVIVSIIDTGGLTQAWSVVLAFALMKLADDAVIQPVVVARSVHMHPLLVLMAVIIGGKFFGILGMILSVPVTGFVKVALSEGLENFRRYRLT